MIIFFRSKSNIVYGVGSQHPLQSSDIQKLVWLLRKLHHDQANFLSGNFIGPRKEMITPWSTNAVEITQTMGITGIFRMEEFFEVQNDSAPYDRMLQRLYTQLDQELFTIKHTPEPILEIQNIGEYNEKEGLALSQEEIEYLNQVSDKPWKKANGQ
jgi:phosphoribosylformylglycinamidine synthase